MMSAPARHRILYSRQHISATVDRLAAEIAGDYRDKHPVIIGVLKGAFIFLADLVRRLDFPLEMDFMQASSYDCGAETSADIKLVQPLRCPVNGRAVLVVEDIVDTGLTTAFIMEQIARQKPSLLKLCALLDKPERRRVAVNIDYLGLTVPNEFLVGYGLDYSQQYRNLPDVCVLKDFDHAG
jgi:hypoxanthine phosphoribosyltransferase